MGIKKLLELVTKYGEKSFSKRHLSYYSFKKIAVDMSIYLYKVKARANYRGNPDKWTDELLHLICILRKNNIHPVFVYDTKAPIEKTNERKKRSEKRKQHSDRIKKLEELVELFETTGKIDDFLLELCEENNKGSRLLRQDRKHFDINTIKEKIEKMKSQIIHITTKDFLLSKQILDELTIPYIDSDIEAEGLCSSLCIENKVDAVLSEDTDVLAYGSPIFLSKIDLIEESVVEINYHILLQEFGMTRESFLDLCLLCGTDYGENMKGVGPYSSFDLIKTHHSIEKISEIVDKKGNKKYNPESLNYIRSRELFQPKKIEDFEMKHTSIPNMNRMEEFFRINNIYFPMSVLRKSFMNEKLVFID